MKHILFIISCSIILCSRLSAQTNPTYSKDVENNITSVLNNLCSEIQVEGEPNWTLAQRMKFYHVKGVSIAVIKDYKIVWARGFGWADSLEQRPVTITTRFQAGSISKSLNSVGVLKLMQDGKLDLYKDINTYLTTWKFPYDTTSHGKKITIANLLSHTAGLTVHGFPGYEQGATIPTLPQILDGQPPANTEAIRSFTEPSAIAQYSGGGTTISQLIVQDVTHMPYDQFMWQNVLQPMGMSNSSYTQPPPTANQQNMATGYYVDGSQVKGRYHIYPEQAAAGLWTTPTDLAKYVIETQRSLNGQSNKVLSQAITKLRLTPYKNNVFGLGVFIDTIAGHEYFSHAGKDEGFTARYFGSFDSGYGVVVMTNTDDIAITNEIINSVAVVYNWQRFYQPFMTLKKPSLSNAVLQSYAGQYQDTTASEGQYNLTPGSIFNITVQGNHLGAQAAGQQMIDIYPSDDVFFPKTSDTDIKFVKDSTGAVTKLIIHQNGKFIECKKIN